MGNIYIKERDLKNGVQGAPRDRERCCRAHILLITHEEEGAIVSTPRDNTLRGRRIPNTYTPAFELWNGTRISVAFLFNETV